MKRSVLLWTGAGVVVVAITAAAWLTSSVKSHTPSLKYHRPVTQSVVSPVDPGTNLKGKPAPNFTLTDQYGKKFSLAQFRGKVVVLAFVDSECTTICPLTTASMVNALQMLGPEAAQHVQLVGVNANPKAISVADVKQYSVSHGMMNSWRFGTASLSQLKSLWQKYNIMDEIVQGNIDHTAALYIIGPQGGEQELFLTPSQYAAVTAQSDVLAKQIARFLPNGVKVNQFKSVNYQPPSFGPGKTVQMPKMTASGIHGQVSIGPGKPQLDVFFASWLTGVKSDLRALNTYAKQPGSPTVVGIDVASTEPKLTSAQSTLAALPSLLFPVGIDKTGEISDAYNVTDLMWLSLTDGKGNIIWSHGGWLAPKTLQADVAKALKSHHVQ